MAKPPSKEYDAASIDWLQGLDGVRKRVSMYLGASDSAAVTHMAVEIIGNSMDEASNGFGDKIGVHFGVDGTITVWDEGRGVPVGPHPKHPKMDALTIVFCELHAGGKMKSDSYSKGSVGVHGVGAAVVNAVSEKMGVWSFRNRQWNHQAFAKGKATTKVIVKSPPSIPGVTFAKKGTIVQFKPDLSCFDPGSKLNIKDLIDWIDNSSWLLPVKFTLINGKNNKVKVIHRPNGLSQRFEHECTTLGVEPMAEPFIYQSDTLDVMVGWTRSSDTHVFSAVNAVRTTEHGTHERGLQATLTDCFASFAKRGDKYKPETLRTGMVALVNVHMHGPKFSSQDKVKLVSKEAHEMVYSELCGTQDAWGALHGYLKSNATLVREVLDRANEITRLKQEFSVNAGLAAAVKTEKRGKRDLPPALKVSVTENAEERELFIVEGQSAGGTSTQARNSYYQEVLSLSGKIPNIWKGKEEKALGNERVIDILKSVGWNPKTPENFRVGRVMLLADGDHDGSHITALLIGFLLKVTPLMFERGMVYVVRAPLYAYQTASGSKVFGLTRAEVQTKVGATLKPEFLTRLKGWGEANFDQLHTIAFNPETRILRRVEGLKSDSELQVIIDWLGEETSVRKTLLTGEAA